MNTPTPNVSFIGIVDFTQEAKWIYMTESVTELLGYERHELIGRPSLELVHPDEFPRVKQIHYETIKQDKAAVLVYLRMRHKDPYKGYILCGVSRTVVHNVLVGSVSFASPAKAMHNASTAQEIEVITPSALNLSFRRWHDPSPMPPSPIPEDMRMPMELPPRRSVSPRSSRSSSPPSRTPPPSSPNGNTLTVGHPSPRPGPHPPSPRLPPIISFAPLPNQSFRTAFILNRFTLTATILYCSNDLLISTSDAIGRPFYDFVEESNENKVKDWVQCVKGWAVNEKGQPSDGGFGFGRFLLEGGGRDSVKRMPEPQTPSRKHAHHPSTSSSSTSSTSTTTTTSSSSRRSHRHPTRSRHPFVLPPPPAPHTSSLYDVEHFEVDAIFSAHSDGMLVILRRATD